MTARPLRGEIGLPAYVSRETGARLLDISTDTWDAMADGGELPQPVYLMDDLKRWRAADLPIPRPIDTWVYFIQCGEFVKIGFATNLNDRISGIRTSTPYEVTLLAVIPGTRKTEKDLHRRFAAHLHRSEWFRLTPEIQAYIDEIKG